MTTSLQSSGGREAPVAIVTGSTSGIGLAIAARFLDNGYRVTVNGRQAARVRQAIEQLGTSSAEAFGVPGDVTDEGQVRHLVDATVTKWGRIDVLVNNAGQTAVAPAEELPTAAWRAVIDLNLTAPFLCAQAAGQVMLQQGSGVIVNVSSVFGQTGNRNRAAYVASKHGLDGLTKALASEWAHRGVRVCSVRPAYVHTALVDSAMASGGFSLEDLQRRTPMRRLGEPAEIADVVAYLASPAASYITGSGVVADGGWLAYGGW